MKIIISEIDDISAILQSSQTTEIELIIGIKTILKIKVQLVQGA